MELIDRSKLKYETVENINSTGRTKQMVDKNIVEAMPVVETIPLKRRFEKIIIEDHNGKPYYNIQYEENGEHHIGYSSYNIDCISDFLKEFFIPVEIKE